MTLCDHQKLSTACTTLTAEGDNKVHDLITQRQIQAMFGLLNVFLDEDVNMTWKRASFFISRIQGHKKAHAWHFCKWTLKFLQARNLPHHCLGQAQWTVLSDKDIASEMKLQIVEKSKKGFMKAEDILNLVASSKMQKIFSERGILKPSISKSMAIRWLKKLDWRYQSIQNGMYIDGHEREDVVAYWRAFLEQWKTYDARFHHWDDNGRKLPRLNDFPVLDGPPFRLVLITHNKSMFYQNDHCKITWAEKTNQPTPQPKGEGQSLMISDFLTSKWGHLQDGDEFIHCLFPLSFYWFVLRKAWVIFKARKNRDGYFSIKDLLTQVDSAIDIFEGLSNGLFKALFFFDNALSHQKWAMDAISA